MPSFGKCSKGANHWKKQGSSGETLGTFENKSGWVHSSFRLSSLKELNFQTNKVKNGEVCFQYLEGVPAFPVTC